MQRLFKLRNIGTKKHKISILSASPLRKLLGTDLVDAGQTGGVVGAITTVTVHSPVIRGRGYTLSPPTHGWSMIPHHLHLKTIKHNSWSDHQSTMAFHLKQFIV